jgi:membrane associated rhomboid family serine protease
VLNEVLDSDLSGHSLQMLMVSLSYSRALTFKALLTIMLLGGGLVWLFGRGGAVHIGASGVIFGLIGFLMTMGAFRREWTALIISAAVLILYGGAVQSLLVYIPGTSWSGHLFGFISGVLAAWLTKKKRVE